MREMTLAQAMEKVGIHSENVRARMQSVRTRAEGWLERVPAPEPLRKFVLQFVRSATDLDLPLRDLAIWVAAVAYVILPFDLISDLIPMLGWTDDLTVMGMALKALRGHWDRNREAGDVQSPTVLADPVAPESE